LSAASIVARSLVIAIANFATAAVKPALATHEYAFR